MQIESGVRLAMNGGTVFVNPTVGANFSGGAGSGGAVRIVANSIENLGVIEVKGGDASGLDPRENGSRYLRDAGGAGGGGRVALLADGVITRGMINLNGGQGNADTFTNQLTIKDSDGNVLASNTNIRTDTTGINGANFTDTLIYTGTGSNVGNINISASDANAPAYLGGPNVDNISVTMTYDTTVIPATIVEEIEDIFESVEEVFEELEFVAIEELFEELITFFEEPAIEMEVVEEFEEVSFEPVLMMIEEMPMEEELIEEEMIEELVMEEESMIEEEFTEEVIEEEFTEEEMIEEEPTKLAEAPSEREEVKQEKPNSKTTKTAEVKKESSTKQKTIQSKERTTNATSQPRLVKLDKIMDKVDKDIKDISKNLQIKNIIKLDAMASDQASLDLYNVPFYKSEDIYLDQLQIQDLRQVYENTTLSSYISTDPIAIVNEKLNQINLKKQQILIELEQLKNG